MKQILIVGDSLASERRQNPPEMVIWPGILSTNVAGSAQIKNISRPYNTSSVLSDVQLNNNTSHLVIQIGIVDCAPRKIGRLSRKVLARFPKNLRESFLSFRKRKASRVYTTEREFESNFRKLLKRSGNTNIIILPILPASTYLTDSNPLIVQNIEMYNAILRKVCDEFEHAFCLDVSTLKNDENFFPDGYHLSCVGHKKVASLVLEALKNEI